MPSGTNYTIHTTITRIEDELKEYKKLLKQHPEDITYKMHIKELKRRLRRCKKIRDKEW